MGRTYRRNRGGHRDPNLNVRQTGSTPPKPNNPHSKGGNQPPRGGSFGPEKPPQGVSFDAGRPVVGSARPRATHRRARTSGGGSQTCCGPPAADERSRAAAAVAERPWPIRVFADGYAVELSIAQGAFLFCTSDQCRHCRRRHLGRCLCGVLPNQIPKRSWRSLARSILARSNRSRSKRARSIRADSIRGDAEPANIDEAFFGRRL